MAARHQPKIQKARFYVGPFPPDAMLGLGNFLIGIIQERLDQGRDVSDGVAPPLKQKVTIPTKSVAGRGSLIQEAILRRTYKDVGYRGRKLRKGLKPIRDWNYTGQTRRSMKVLRAGVGKVTVGFVGAVANRRASINNWRWRQFGVSPGDRRILRPFVDRMMREVVRPIAA